MVVPFYNVEKYFAECLDSILAQGFVDYEVLLVDDGSPDGSRAIAQAYAERDARFRILTRPNGGLGAARNTGLAQARGRWITFVDSDDELTPGALEALVSSARRTGSQIVVAAVERFDSTTAWIPQWVDQVHAAPLDRVRLTEYLPLLRNLYTWNKLYDREFFLSQGHLFREGVAYEDQPIVTQLLNAAPAIDVIPDVVYRYRMRDDRSSISQQTATVKDLRDRVEAWRVSAEAVRTMPDEVGRAWLQTLFDAHFNWYLISSGTVEEEYWELIQRAVVELTASAGPEIWAAAPPQNRVLLELTRQNRRADLQEFVRQDAVQKLALFPARVHAEGLLFDLPFLGDPRLPDELFLLRRAQLQASHAIERVSWTAESLDLSGWAFIRKLDQSDHPSHVDLVLTGRTSGTERVWPAFDDVSVVSPPPIADDWADYSHGSFRVSVPTDELLEPTPGQPLDTAWDVALRITAAGFTVTEQITHLSRNGSAGALEQHLLADGRGLALSWRHRHPLVLRLVPATVRVDELTLTGRTLAGRIAGPDAEQIAVVELTGVGLRSSTLGPERRFSLEVPTPRQVHAGQPVLTTLRAVSGEGRAIPLTVGEDVTLPEPAQVGDHTLVLTPDRLNTVQVAEWTHGVEGLRMSISDAGGLRLEGVVRGPGVRGVALITRGSKAVSDGRSAPVAADGTFVVDHDLCSEVYRFGRWPLPIGQHQIRVCLELTDGTDLEVPLTITRALNRQLPLAVDTDLLEGRLLRGHDGGVMIALVRPLGEDRSRYHQNRLQLEAAAITDAVATRRGVLFRAYFGERATDNGIAIAEELARRGSDLPVYWAVQDHSVPVPAGAQAVVVNSPEFYRLLREVTYLVDNMYQPEFHNKPTGQVIVQTFHGYPFKQMGRPHWIHQQFSQAKIDSYARRSTEWDYLVSPARYATELLTRDFGYDGPVLEIGYPRNDVLLAPDADEIRRVTRESLGLRPDQTAVLYAPTFRDYLAKDDNKALMSDFFDFEEVARAFGDDVVVLMRGHAFHARTKYRIGDRATTIDVTDYPEVADLYLAADVCVADYSSLRFDFGVTGKPMIFLVPDLERYVESRGWLFDYEPTAPGPLVSSTAEVIGALRDLPGLRAAHAEQYERFRAEYLDLEDGYAAARFVDAVFVPRGDAPPA